MYGLLGKIIDEAEKGNAQGVIILNRKFWEIFISKERGMPEELKLKYNSALNASLASLMDGKRHDELIATARQIYNSLPKP